MELAPAAAEAAHASNNVNGVNGVNGVNSVNSVNGANGVNGVNQLNGSGPDHRPSSHYKAIVIGAGFGGLRMLHELRELGIDSVKILDDAPDVGGTWYWNRYPGARTDSESWVYIMNFSKELKADWVWKERYPTQDQVFDYLRHVADRFDMRRNIQLKTRVQSAHFDEGQNLWRLTTAGGQEYTCDLFIPAVGLLSAGLKPPYPGLQTFQGEWYQASNWPDTGKRIDFTSKRVAVIGTGATGIQITPIAAHTAKSVTVFQRTPNYVIPARNTPISEDQMTEIKRDYDDIWDLAKNQVFGFPIPTRGRTMQNVPDALERQRVLEAGWEAGGFRFMCETFDDMVVNKESNDLASNFIRQKIRTIVRDPKTAEKLCPKYPFLVKRPPLGHFYYEAFNRPNVELVDISNDGIRDVTPTGLHTETGNEYDFDVIIFAIGFDAVTGPLTQIDIRGRHNRSLREEWSQSVKTHLGLAVEGFPNMFMISGPQGPFGNASVTIDYQVTSIGKAIKYLNDHGHRTMEVTPEAQRTWCAGVKEAYDKTIISTCSEQTHSWYVGANVPGKPFSILLYFGGLGRYTQLCEEEAEAGFPGFRFS